MILDNSKIQNRNAQYKTFGQLKDRRLNSKTHSTSLCDPYARLSAAIVNNAFIQYAHCASGNKRKGKPKSLKAEQKNIETFFKDFNNPCLEYLQAIGHELTKGKCLKTLKEIGIQYGKKRNNT